MAKKYYQMLWDCEYCGAKGLLAKDQKVCPQCAGKQNPEKRYMPDMAQAQEVVGHVVKGADRVCGGCGRILPVSVTHCTGCGRSMEGASEVQRKSLQAGGLNAPKSALQSSRKFIILFFAVPLLIALGFGGFFMLDNALAKPSAFLLEGKSWSATIDIEQYGPETRTYSCEAPPELLPRPVIPELGEQVLWVQSSPAGVQVAQNDEGDGTFSVETSDAGSDNSDGDQATSSKTCTETIYTWKHARTLSESGSELPVRWPLATLTTDEREGGRRVDWNLNLITSDQSKRAQCAVAETLWNNASIGSAWVLELGYFTGSPRCGTLTPALAEAGQ